MNPNSVLKMALFTNLTGVLRCKFMQSHAVYFVQLWKSMNLSQQQEARSAPCWFIIKNQLLLVLQFFILATQMEVVWQYKDNPSICLVLKVHINYHWNKNPDHIIYIKRVLLILLITWENISPSLWWPTRVNIFKAIYFTPFCW